MNIKEMKAHLLAEIENGTYQETMKLPTEDQLIQKFGSTRYSVRTMIEELVEMSVVYQVQGSGNYLRENTREGSVTLSSTKGISKEFPNKKVHTELISLEVIQADSQLAAQFNCALDTEIYDIVRIRYVDDLPFAVEYSKFNKEIVPYLNKEIIEQSIYQYIQTALKLTIGFADKVIQTRKINAWEAEVMNLEMGDPAIIINDVVYLKNGVIFNCSSVAYNHTLAKFFEPAIFK